MSVYDRSLFITCTLTLGQNVSWSMIDWFDLWNVYDHTHHSLLAKLGRWGSLMRMSLAWKKSQIISKRLYQNKTRSTGVRAKDWIPNFAIIGNCRFRNGQGPGRGWNPYPGAPPTTRLLVVGHPSPNCFVWGSFITDHRPLSHLLQHVGRGVYIITQILHRYPFGVRWGQVLMYIIIRSWDT